MPLYEFECPVDGRRTEEFRSLHDATRAAKCGTCGGPAKRVMSLTATPRIGQGRSAESAREFAAREREKLTKRSDAYDATSRGKDDRQESVERQKKAGNLPW